MVSAAAVTTIALATAVPLAYFQYQRSIKRNARESSLKLIRKVELIVGEVKTRLIHMEKQTEELIAYGEQTEEEPAPEIPSTLNSYYHFDSKGNKLRTKWDTYDVDAELERLDADEKTSASSPATTNNSVHKRPITQQKVNKSTLLNGIAGIEQEFEAVLEFLDDIRGDETVKEARKTLITKVTKEYLKRVDGLRTTLASA